MAEALRHVFSNAAKEHRTVFVAFITAGFPTISDTVPIMLALQAGGVDIIEIGVPFSDPVADGVAIQESNFIAIENGVDYGICLDIVRKARGQGVSIPILLMGYYNPLRFYGEEKAVKHARSAGANGFIVVDLPPEESSTFRSICKIEKMSYVPLIAPSTSLSRIRFLAGIVDSFAYIVSKMGTTGSSPQTAMNKLLPELISRVKDQLDVPVAVGFGVATPEHFKAVADAGSDAVVIGSRLLGVIKDSDNASLARNVTEFCADICGGRHKTTLSNGHANGNGVHSNGLINHDDRDNTSEDALTEYNSQSLLPTRFGLYGGQYVPEALFECVQELEQAHVTACADPEFWEEFRSYFGYLNRPSQLYFAPNLTQHIGGAKIWLKREDLNHTGSHKINNALGQILLARRLGKTRIIAETGAGQHGVATATVCARFGLECVIYMGSDDAKRQALNVFRMQMLGAKVVKITSGAHSLKEAINECMRDWVTNLSTTHYLVGSAIGPHPFPTIVRDFQKVIGQEIKTQLLATVGKLPDAVVACCGGGSNAIGSFYDFIPDSTVRLVGVESSGTGLEDSGHSASLAKGKLGVLHGVETYVLQLDGGQIMRTHSISAGLDYAAVGPEHAYLRDIGRAEYRLASDEQALRAFRLCTQLEGITPALESAHGLWGGLEIAKELPKDANVVVCLSGRGDKDVEQISRLVPEKWADILDWHIGDEEVR